MVVGTTKPPCRLDKGFVFLSIPMLACFGDLSQHPEQLAHRQGVCRPRRDAATKPVTEARTLEQNASNVKDTTAASTGSSETPVVRLSAAHVHHFTGIRPILKLSDHNLILDGHVSFV